MSSVNSFGHTPLMLAAQHGHGDVMEQLLDHHTATMHGDVMEQLFTPHHQLSTDDVVLRRGSAAVTQRSRSGATALDMAARRGDVMIMRLIVKHVEGSAINVRIVYV